MKKRLLGVGAALATLLIALLFLLDLPAWQALDMDKLTKMPEASVLYDVHGTAMTTLYAAENRLYVASGEIPQQVKDAFVAIEDARFYRHHGVDVRRILGALLRDITSLSLKEGASTITQQLIKLTHLSPEKTLSRKAQEAWLAIQLERRCSKDGILTMYLNAAYFGHGAYGIGSAARIYFDKTPAELTLAEAALLAGVVKSPAHYAPHRNPEDALARRSLVLDAMMEQGMITPQEAEAAKGEALHLRSQEEEGSRWYADYALSEAARLLGVRTDEVCTGGYSIHTTVDPALQAQADRLFEDPSLFPADAADGEPCQAALVALDVETGGICCLVGGRSDAVRRGLNRATQAMRQPGSALKPVSVYAAAIDLLGCTPVTLLRDEERDFGGGYTPHNAGRTEYGLVTLRQALARSMNLATMDLMTRVGVGSAAMYARRAGLPLTEEDENLSLALGSLTYGVTPLSLCAAYRPIAAKGEYTEPYVIERIEDAKGRVLWRHKSVSRPVMRPESAAMLTGVLESAASWGTASALASVPGQVAAKTGTVGAPSGGNQDIWTVACTPQLTVTVWMGFDRGDEGHVLPEGTVGGGYPARLAARLLEAVASPQDHFPVPATLTEVTLDAKALALEGRVLLASEYTPAEERQAELLPPSQVPTEVSDLWNPPLTPQTLSLREDEPGRVTLSLISLDGHTEYRVIRRTGQEETEVAALSGRAGSYLVCQDTPQAHCEYIVRAVHPLRLAAGLDGMAPDSEPVAWRGGVSQKSVPHDVPTPAPDPLAPLLPPVN